MSYSKVIEAWVFLDISFVSHDLSLSPFHVVCFEEFVIKVNDNAWEVNIPIVLNLCTFGLSKLHCCLKQVLQSRTHPTFVSWKGGAVRQVLSHNIFSLFFAVRR